MRCDNYDGYMKAPNHQQDDRFESVTDDVMALGPDLPVGARGFCRDGVISVLIGC